MTTHFEQRSCDSRLPLWLRLTALAVESAEPDALGSMVALFAPGEVRHRLAGGVDLAPASVTQAIRVAERHGFLAAGSSTRCLRLVPGSLTLGAQL